MTIGTPCILKPINPVAFFHQDYKRIQFYIFFGFTLICAVLLLGCVSSDCSRKIRFIHDPANATGYELLEIDKCVFRGAAATDVMIVLELWRRDRGSIVLLDKPPKWQIVKLSDNNPSRLGTVRISFEKSENCDVVSVSVFVRRELALKKSLDIINPAIKY